MRKIVLVATLMVLTASLSFAQEKPRAEELMRYFPQGNYTNINHRDNTVDHSDSPHWPMLQNYRKKARDIMKDLPGNEVWPKTITEKATSITMGSMYTLAEKVVALPAAEAQKDLMQQHQYLREKYPQMASVKVHGQENSNGEVEFSIQLNTGGSFHVYRYDDVRAIIDAALKEEIIKPSGNKIRKRPIFRFANDSGFMYATDFNEILISDTAKNIRLMVAVGDGMQPGIFEDKECVDLIQLVSTLPESWSVSFPRATMVGLVSKSEYNKSYDNDFSIASYPLYTVSTFEIDAELVLKTMSLYDNPEDAEKELKRMKARYSDYSKTPAAFKASMALQEKQTKRKVDDCWYIQTITFDQDYMQKQFKLTKQFAKEMKEKRAEMEKAKKEQEAAKNKQKEK